MIFTYYNFNINQPLYIYPCHRKNSLQGIPNTRISQNNLQNNQIKEKKTKRELSIVEYLSLMSDAKAIMVA